MVFRIDRLDDGVLEHIEERVYGALCELRNYDWSYIMQHFDDENLGGWIERDSLLTLDLDLAGFKTPGERWRRLLDLFDELWRGTAGIGGMHLEPDYVGCGLLRGHIRCIVS